MSDKWIVSYTDLNGTPGEHLWDNEEGAKNWIAYHRAEKILFNLELRHVTNWKPISPQAALAMTGKLGDHPMTTGTPTHNNLTCPHCGLQHVTTCYRIKAIEYASDGVTVIRIEFHEPKPVLPAAAPPIGTGTVIGGFAGTLHNKD